MKRVKLFGVSLGLVLGFVFVITCFAQTTPTAGGITAQQRELEKEKKIEKKIGTEKTKAQETLTPEMLSDTGPKVLVKSINVEGATLLTQQEITAITSPYQGMELSLRSMQKIADLITDEYRKKGYATSRAYLPPQSIKEGVLLIKVVEGKLGQLEIRGNQHFKTSLLEQKINLKPGGYFDYSALQKSLVYINEAPDRKARVTLVPGKAAGTTDVVIDVKDKLPIHAGFEYDNYASRYLDRNRYSLVLEDNNLFGFDDKLYIKALIGEAKHLLQYQGRYSFPINDGFDIGGYFLISKTRLGKEFTDLASKGKAEIYGLFSSYALINTQAWDLRLNGGFDYKNIDNYLIGTRTSRDDLRVLKIGADSDSADAWGRNIASVEVDQGIKEFLGGMDKKDLYGSRAGGGGQFTKFPAYYFRLQKMPWETTLLWKNMAQYSNNALVASEQFQAGGPISVRGYPAAEYVGDKGFYTSPELSLPIYCLKKDWKVPHNEETWYDTTRLVLFYDWATTRLNRVGSGEKKNHTIKGFGYGLRFNLRDNLSFRVEVGYPLGKPTPSDGHDPHMWCEFTSKF
ncbi:MAG: hypothetical protein NTY14_03365 [Candidatus Omnitrophica bacterium]|nr:hypothetical protein [Candidatus Omnitrophota bacterium]